MSKTGQTTAATGGWPTADAQDGYETFQMLIRDRVVSRDRTVFTTKVAPEALWDAYLNALPEDSRQHYNCNSCKAFVQKYGGLATIGDDGKLAPLLWHPADRVPPFFQNAVLTLSKMVAASRVTGVFLSADSVWGKPATPDQKKSVVWTHLHGQNPHVYRGALLDAGQAVAAKKEEYIMLLNAVSEYSPQVAQEACRLLKSGHLTRSEKALAQGEWFAKLHGTVGATVGKVRENLLWKAVAAAPPGFCHVRSNVISTLYDSLLAKDPLEATKNKWAEKLNPGQYQRPSAPVSDGQIEQAEKAFAELNAAPAFRRRYATLDDVLAKLWVPQLEVAPEPKGGVFGALKEKNKKEEVAKHDLPNTNVSWRKFSEDVLPGAAKLEARTPPSWNRGPFYGLLTAADPDARAVLQWDGLEGHPRNPVSWYFWNRERMGSGSTAAEWGLPGNEFVPVTAVFLAPPRWQEPAKFAHQGNLVMFALKGCQEKLNGVSLGMFPEILRSEFHAFRKVIERYNETRSPEGADQGTANGLAYQPGYNGATLTIRVTDKTGGRAVYTLDRWD